MSEDWGKHYYRVGTNEGKMDSPPQEKDFIQKYRGKIEPWLSAVFQSEHLSLLVGGGLTIALCNISGSKAGDMTSGPIEGTWKDEIENHSREAVEKMGRGEPNIEDRLRSALQLLLGLEVTKGKSGKDYSSLKEIIDSYMKKFLEGIGLSEKNYMGKKADKEKNRENTDNLLVSFLLSFACRTPSRERLNIFTTNYERFIEYGCDKAGLRIIDRFVGTIDPVFRASRIDVDMHYNPPGIRGEPRYLEGVVKLTKLHGSIDWLIDKKNHELKRRAFPFGAAQEVPREPTDTVMIYPNAAKDVETLEYPYAELFRDFAAAVCRPNSVLVTYGYGFGDDHINRVISDMLTVPSTHLVIISYGELERIRSFCDKYGRKAQISFLLGGHFGNLPDLVENYLPKPAIDTITIRQTRLLENRGERASKEPNTQDPTQGE